MIIMCDIDNVLNDLAPKTLAMYNAENDRDIKMSDINYFNFYDCLSAEDASGLIELFERKDLWDSLIPSSDAQWGLKTLIADGHEVYLATSTNPINFPWKIEWLKKYFPFIDKHNVICIQNKGLLKCDVMIDDCYDNLINNTCKRIVIEYPWNQDEKTEQKYDIYRAYNFKDVIEIIQNMEGSEE